MAEFAFNLVSQLCDFVHKASGFDLFAVHGGLGHLLLHLRLLRRSRHNRSPLNTPMLPAFTNRGGLLLLVVLDATLRSPSVAVFG